MNLLETLDTLNRFKHRGFDRWSLFGEKGREWFGPLDSAMVSLSQFEAIAIAEALVKQDKDVEPTFTAAQVYEDINEHMARILNHESELHNLRKSGDALGRRWAEIAENYVPKKDLESLVRAILKDVVVVLPEGK